MIEEVIGTKIKREKIKGFDPTEQVVKVATKPKSGLLKLAANASEAKKPRKSSPRKVADPGASTKSKTTKNTSSKTRSTKAVSATKVSAKKMSAKKPSTKSKLGLSKNAATPGQPRSGSAKAKPAAPG